MRKRRTLATVAAMSTPSSQELETLLAGSPVQKYPPESVLVHKGQIASSALFLEQGTVATGVLERPNPSGQGLELEQQWLTITGPDWIDLSTVLLGQAACADMVTVGHASVRIVPRKELLNILQNQTGAAYAVLQQVARSSHKQTELIMSRLVKDAEARCAEWLLQHARQTAHGCAVELQERKRHIAAQLGIAPETLSRVLRHLRDQQLITGSGKTVELVDVGGLRLLAGH